MAGRVSKFFVIVILCKLETVSFYFIFIVSRIFYTSSPQTFSLAKKKKSPNF